MDHKNRFEMRDMSAVDKFVAMVKIYLIQGNNKMSMPDMLDMARKVANNEAEANFDEMAEVEGGL